MLSHCTFTIHWQHLTVDIRWPGRKGTRIEKVVSRHLREEHLMSKHLRDAQCLPMVLYVKSLGRDVARRQGAAFEEGLMNHSNKGCPEFFQMGTLIVLDRVEQM